MPFTQAFQFAHLCIPEGAESLRADLGMALKLSELSKRIVARYSDSDRLMALAERDPELQAIIDEMAATCAVFFDVETSIDLSPEDIEALKVSVANPIVNPNREVRRAHGLGSAGAPRRVRQRFEGGEWRDAEGALPQ